MIETLGNNLTFKEIIRKIEAIKDQYKRDLSLFSCGFDIKKKVKYIKETKANIYSLRDEKEKWQCDRIWDYMNDSMTYNELLEIANRQTIKKMI